MIVREMSKKNQLLLLGVVGLIIVGAYVKVRYLPAAAIVATEAELLEKNIDKIDHPVFPEEPLDSADELQVKLEELEASLAGLTVQASQSQQKLATADNQDVFIKLSEAARIAGVKITENVPYIVQRRIKVAEADPAKNLTPKQLKKQKKATRRRASASGQAAIGALPKHGSLIDRTVNDLPEAMHLHKVTVEGPFYHFQTFMQAVQALPWQVTIVKLDIDLGVVGQAVPQGAPQPISVKMIVAI